MSALRSNFPDRFNNPILYTIYSKIDNLGYGVIRMPGIDKIGIPYSKSFIVGIVVICIIIVLMYFAISFIIGEKSGLRNASTIRYNIQDSQYGGNVIVSDSIISENKLDIAMEGM